MTARTYSVVQFFPEEPGHSCGYCKSTDGFIAQGMWAHVLNVEQYQQLVDRGWRRSGSYCYKPTMNKICCPPYTIRCDATQVQLTKSQKKVARRMRNFLLHGKEKLPQRDLHNKEDTMNGGMQHSHMELDIDSDMLERMASRASGDLPQTSAALLNSDLSDGPPSPPPRSGSREPASGPQVPPSGPQVPPSGPAEPQQWASEEAAVGQRSSCLVRPGVGMDPARPACRKQKALRRERWRQKHVEVAAPPPPPPLPATQLEDMLADPAGAKHKLKVRVVASSPPSREYLRSKSASFLVYKQYQMAVHGDDEDKCTMHTYERFLGTSPLRGPFLPMCRSHVLAILSLFCVAAPSWNWMENEHARAPYGSYHQQYWLDEELIAVGVLDVLPSCVSSKYFFYLPRYGFLSLGTYSSLRELALTRHLHRSHPDIRFYYMGYYIHTCPKMSYKSRLWPSFLLCPETYTWHPVAKCTPLLDQSKYSRLSPADARGEPPADPSGALVLHNRSVMRYPRYRQMTDARDEDEVIQYVRLVGPAVAACTLLYRE